jgi:hypothetical protein
MTEHWAEAAALADELLANDPRLAPEDAFAFAAEQVDELLAFAAGWDAAQGGSQ